MSTVHSFNLDCSLLALKSVELLLPDGFLSLAFCQVLLSNFLASESFLDVGGSLIPLLLHFQFMPLCSHIILRCLSTLSRLYFKSRFIALFPHFLNPLGMLNSPAGDMTPLHCLDLRSRPIPLSTGLLLPLPPVPLSPQVGYLSPCASTAESTLDNCRRSHLQVERVLTSLLLTKHVGGLLSTLLSQQALNMHSSTLPPPTHGLPLLLLLPSPIPGQTLPHCPMKHQHSRQLAQPLGPELRHVFPSHLPTMQ
mmetsp:Transcript_3911/g.5157  ORF Transcript_3911/g.5157 Transcript_3911/m.5157 type:complete len:252 (+) Transcript_3911:220-975(+)